MNKAVFLDRDGVINIDYGYVYKIDDFIFEKHILDVLRFFQDKGYLLVVVSNQSGIGRGFFSEDDLNNLDKWMKRKLSEEGIVISKSYYCPHYINSDNTKYAIDCDCRKPKLGMFEKAIRDLDIDIEESVVIGDKLRDCMISLCSGCKGFIVGKNEDDTIIKSVEKGEYKNIRYCVDLLDVIKYF